MRLRQWRFLLRRLSADSSCPPSCSKWRTMPRPTLQRGGSRVPVQPGFRAHLFGGGVDCRRALVRTCIAQRRPEPRNRNLRLCCAGCAHRPYRCRASSLECSRDGRRGIYAPWFVLAGIQLLRDAAQGPCPVIARQDQILDSSLVCVGKTAEFKSLDSRA
jgi:hypothetical protein